MDKNNVVPAASLRKLVAEAVATGVLPTDTLSEDPHGDDYAFIVRGKGYEAQLYPLDKDKFDAELVKAAEDARKAALKERNAARAAAKAAREAQEAASQTKRATQRAS